MAVRMMPLLLTILNITNLALSAPTAKDPSLPPSTISTSSQPAPPGQIPEAASKRHHIIRVSKTTSDNDSNKSFFDTTTLHLLETSPHTEPVPVFTSSSKDQIVVTVLDDDNNDNDDNLIASYIQEKLAVASSVPDGGRQQQQPRILCRALRRCGQRVLEQRRLGLFILGVSLGLAFICTCMRELCSMPDDESLGLESRAIEEATATSSKREKS